MSAIRRDRCAVNDALGGGIFVCRRPLSPEGNGAFCALHGSSNARLELTWPAWFKAWFVYQPRNLLLRIKNARFAFRLWRETRHNPPCSTTGCRKHSVQTCTEDGEIRHMCFDHFGY